MTNAAAITNPASRLLVAIGLVVTLMTCPWGAARGQGASDASTGSDRLKAAIARAEGHKQKLPDKIIGGTNAKWQDHPWQVALLAAKIKDADKAQFCGGSLLRPNWVVTAAHCVDKGTLPKQVDVLSGTALLGTGGTRTQVERIIVHKSFNSPMALYNDIALLKLKGDGTGSVIQLVDPSEESKVAAPGKLGMVSGWGVTESGFPSPQLKQVEVPIVEHAKCNGPGSYDGKIADSMLCAGYDQGAKDSCAGDSGGPLTSAKRLIGVVSWGEGCAQPFRYGVYTRVAKFKSWIEGCIGAPDSCK